MQPDLILIPFGKNATAGTIEPIPETIGPGDGPQKATWNYGFPQVTMTPLAAGGIPPQGQDVNGVLNAISEHTVFLGGGGQYKWSAEYVTENGGYAIGDVIQADDGLNSYVSLVNTNTTNFNTTPAAIGVSWGLYAGRNTQTQATEAVPGIAEIATQAEVATGTDNSRIVTPSKLAVRLSAGAPISGSARNLKMSVAAASASATLTADEVIVKSALGGSAWLLPSFNKVIDLSTVGAGGMDAGAAPASGFVSIYAIYNQVTNTSALLACNQTVSSGNVYSGANMPSGYTASALVSAWKTTAGGLLVTGLQVGRQINVAQANINTSSVNQSNTLIDISGIVPIAAKEISGLMQCGSSAASNATMSLSGTVSPTGTRNIGASVPAGTVVQGAFSGLSLGTPTTVFYTANASSGALSSTAYMTSYTI